MKRKHLIIAVVIAALCALMAVPAASAATAKPAQVKGVTAKAAGATSVKITWKTVAKAKGYKVRYSKKASMAGAKTVTVKGAKKKARTLKKLSGCTKYYVQVRAYKSKKVLGKWSAKKAVKTAHIYKAVAGKDATCTEAGYTAHKQCTVCGATVGKKTVAAKGHSYSEAIVYPTCTEGGYTLFTCDRCGNEYTANATEALGHDLVSHEAKAATCTEVGWNAYVTCSRCSYTTYKEIPALGHANDGICTRCGEITYSWHNLKIIAQSIAGATTESGALAIAKNFGLLGSDGKLTGNEVKSFTLTDGTKCQAQILGFWHDDKADGSGKAGITFGFKGIPKYHAMNSTDTNSGGWKSSGMRTWLSSDFYALLPADLQEQIVAVDKKTNNTGETNSSSSVTTTSDKLWLLSFRECYGTWTGNSSYTAVYGAEGTQYKLYSDNGVTTSSYSFLVKYNTSGIAGLWWLRSPNAVNSLFLLVDNSGDWGYGSAVYSDGVSPGFCF